LLDQNGIKIINGNIIEPTEIKSNEKNEFKKILTKFILKFNKMTIQYEKNIVVERYLGNDTDLVVEEIIPLCLSRNIVESVETKQSRQAGTKAYRLSVDMVELLRHDGVDDDHVLSKFWKEVNNK